MHRHSIHIKRIYTNTWLPLNNARETLFSFPCFLSFCIEHIFICLTFIISNINVLKQFVINDVRLCYTLGGWTLFLQHTWIFPGDALSNLGCGCRILLPTSPGSLAQSHQAESPHQHWPHAIGTRDKRHCAVRDEPPPPPGRSLCPARSRPVSTLHMS